MSINSPKQKNLQSQLKRIAKRTAQELFCLALILARGYNVQFIKPRQSKKVTPFLLIEKIYKDEEVLFDISNYDIQKIIDELKETKDEDKKKYKPETKEIRTSIVMNGLVNILYERTIRPYPKFKTQYSVNPKFVWLSCVRIFNETYHKKDIYELGEMMFDIVEESMKSNKNNQVFDYTRFVTIVNPPKDEKLVKFFNMIEHRRRWVYLQTTEELSYSVENKEEEIQIEIENWNFTIDDISSIMESKGFYQSRYGKM